MRLGEVLAPQAVIGRPTELRSRSSRNPTGARAIGHHAIPK